MSAKQGMEQEKQVQKNRQWSEQQEGPQLQGNIGEREHRKQEEILQPGEYQETEEMRKQEAKEASERKEYPAVKESQSPKERPEAKAQEVKAQEVKAQEVKECQDYREAPGAKEHQGQKESEGAGGVQEAKALSAESECQQSNDLREPGEFSEENKELSEENRYQEFEEYSEADEIPEHKECSGTWKVNLPWKNRISMKDQKNRKGQKGNQRNPEKRNTKKRNTKKKSRAANRREVLLTGGFFSVLFLVMIGYLGYFTATSEQEMINNSYNSRQEILLSRNYRGAILDRNGEVLAETVVDDEQNETRVYPYAKLFSHIVGYSTKGRMGVEALANYYLINTNTSLSNKAANDIAGVKNPGDTVYTTLDVQLQQVADSQLDIYKGAIVVTEVSTGKLLAMVSHPNFDPNKIADMWDSFIEDENSSVLLNRATQGLYPPGSTFKMVTALEYIRQNPDTYQEYSFQCTGYYQSGSNRISCYHGTNHGVVDFERSFAKSCNSSFANIGMGLDRGKFADTLNGLLFDEPLPLTLTYNRSSTAVSEEMSAADMMQTSIGQGKTQITPIHLNMITSAIANGGILMKPYVIDHVENDAGNVVKSFQPDSYGRLLSEEESAILKELMTAVVESGTATNLAGREYSAAGKTGSAEYNDNGDSHAWFTGFAPVDNPEICVTIIVEGAGSGGDYAVPIARRIFDAYFNQKK